MITRKYVLITIFLIGFISCKTEVKPINIINKSVQAHGGLERWKQLKSLSFTKKTTLYYEDGSVRLESTQNQSFLFGKYLSGTIHSILDSVSYRFKKSEVYMQTKDSSAQLSGEALKSKQRLFASALYVTSQPFQLLESGAAFERTSDTIFGDKKAFAVRVYYPNDTTTSDQWTYYFDQDSFLVVACKVKHDKRTSIIENLSYDQSTPFIFNATRKSTITENGKAAFVIAEYEYSDYQVH